MKRLQIAPSTKFAHHAQQRDPHRRTRRARRDDGLRGAIRRSYKANYQVCGPQKVGKELRREGRRVARCTIERLMRAMASGA
jgi:putative transposase